MSVEIKEKMLKMVDMDKLYAIVRGMLPTKEQNTLEVYQLSSFLNTWATNKQKLFVLFGEKLTVECGNTDLPITENEFKTLEGAFLKRLDSGKTSSRKESDLETLPDFSFVKLLYNEIVTRGFKVSLPDNLSTSDITVGNTVFKKGTKVSKILSTFVEKKDVNVFTSIFSQFVQSLKTKGTAFISIDPVEFLTSSLTKANWTSCHSIRGDWQMGNVSYLQDETSAISFSSNSKLHDYMQKDIDYSSFFLVNHISKSWRQMVYISADDKCFFQSRQYPNLSVSSQGVVKKKLIDIMGIQEPIEDNTDTVIEIACGSSHYQDFVAADSVNDDALFVYDRNVEYKEIVVGSEVKCLRCGNSVYSPAFFYCSDCYGEVLDDADSDDYSDDYDEVND